jgi:benzoyl-CoA 2,3-epoxidase subunit B
MTQVNKFDLIPNNVGLTSDKRLQRALETWLPSYLDWWREMGPAYHQQDDIYLRTAISVDTDGWANFGYVRMPEYRWGIFLADQVQDRKVHFGDRIGEPVFQEVPGEYRNTLRRIIVTQADTEPASVEQQRRLSSTAPSLYDMRNLFQVNVEEGRHLWAMVYLLHGFFGKDGRDESEELLRRRAGNADKPRILGAFNQPCNDWLSFFCFTMFTDRDGKYQLAALSESALDPLSRTCRFMLTEEAHHMFVGETGVGRVVDRTAQLMKEHPGRNPREVGGIDLATIQKAVNYWYTYSLDLFGGEISSNAADYFAAGLKGRYQESKLEEHTARDQVKEITVIENGRLTNREVPLRNAMNEVLREAYITDCERGVSRWNKTLAEHGLPDRIVLPNRRFHRHQGEYAGHHFDFQGEPIGKEQFEAQRAEWFLSQDDLRFLADLMVLCDKPGQIASWIAPPKNGINGKPFDFEYVKTAE